MSSMGRMTPTRSPEAQAPRASNEASPLLVRPGVMLHAPRPTGRGWAQRLWSRDGQHELGGREAAQKVLAQRHRRRMSLGELSQRKAPLLTPPAGGVRRGWGRMGW